MSKLVLDLNWIVEAAKRDPKKLASFSILLATASVGETLSTVEGYTDRLRHYHELIVRMQSIVQGAR